jgi:trans-aconitate 2-methyltransferase
VTAGKSREWDSTAYDRISAPQFSWGKKVLDRVSLRGDECLLDAGCGTGKLIPELLSGLTSGHVVGVDLSQNMLRTARESLEPRFPSRIAFVAADLQRLPFNAAFDGIFSTAAFHWVPDHDLLFRSLYGALRPGGWVIAQCGGAGNLDCLLARVARLAQAPKYAAHVGNYKHSWVFADPPTTAKRLQAAGFGNIETSLELAPTRFENEIQFAEFVSKVILHRFLEHFRDDSMRHEFVAEIGAQAARDQPPYELDYVRLNLSGRKHA